MGNPAVMETRCVKCSKILTDSSGYIIDDAIFDTDLIIKKLSVLSLLVHTVSVRRVTFAWCRKCYAEEKNEMSEGQEFCWNYRNVEQINAAIRRHNETHPIQFTEHAPDDVENCLSCDKYPALMPMKICFDLKITWYPSADMIEEDADEICGIF
jgi:hypothetical protein